MALLKRGKKEGKVVFLSREKLLEKEELEVVEVDLGKGEFVCVRQMTGRERDQFEKSLMKETKDKKGNVGYDRNLGDFRAKLAVNTVCDEEGKLVFRPQDYETLSVNISALRLEKIVNEAQKLNAITEEDKEELVKNLDAAQSGSSTLDSAEN